MPPPNYICNDKITNTLGTGFARVVNSSTVRMPRNSTRMLSSEFPGPANGLSPTVTAREGVMRERVAPWNEREENNNHQDGLDMFRYRCVDLVCGP